MVCEGLTGEPRWAAVVSIVRMIIGGVIRFRHRRDAMIYERRDDAGATRVQSAKDTSG